MPHILVEEDLFVLDWGLGLFEELEGNVRVD